MTAKRNSQYRRQRKKTYLAAAWCILISAACAVAEEPSDGYLPIDAYSGTVKQSGGRWLLTPCTEDESRAWELEWLREEDEKTAEKLTALYPPRSRRHSQPAFWLKAAASVNSGQNSVRIHEIMFYRENESCRPMDYLDVLFPP